MIFLIYKNNTDFLTLKKEKYSLWMAMTLKDAFSFHSVFINISVRFSFISFNTLPFLIPFNKKLNDHNANTCSITQHN